MQDRVSETGGPVAGEQEQLHDRREQGLGPRGAEEADSRDRFSDQREEESVGHEVQVASRGERAHSQTAAEGQDSKTPTP